MWDSHAGGEARSNAAVREAVLDRFTWVRLGEREKDLHESRSRDGSMF